jgi:hypothetical protein
MGDSIAQVSGQQVCIKIARERTKHCAQTREIPKKETLEYKEKSEHE